MAEQGNAAAMRAALVEARKVIEAMGGYWARETLPIIDAAIASPPRNCDVGTADEQARRFQLFCQDHRGFNAECSAKCPFVNAADINHCQSGWMQMPYEKEGASDV